LIPTLSLVPGGVRDVAIFHYPSCTDSTESAISIYICHNKCFRGITLYPDFFSKYSIQIEISNFHSNYMWLISDKARELFPFKESYGMVWGHNLKQDCLLCRYIYEMIWAH
jgi:hypothetical protein